MIFHHVQEKFVLGFIGLPLEHAKSSKSEVKNFRQQKKSKVADAFFDDGIQFRIQLLTSGEVLKICEETRHRINFKRLNTFQETAFFSKYYIQFETFDYGCRPSNLLILKGLFVMAIESKILKLIITHRYIMIVFVSLNLMV